MLKMAKVINGIIAEVQSEFIYLVGLLWSWDSWVFKEGS
jgi:hypothetical protein